MNIENYRICPICGFEAPDEVSMEKLHYCGKCGAPLRLINPYKRNAGFLDFSVYGIFTSSSIEERQVDSKTYQEYEVVEKGLTEKLKNENQQKEYKIKELKDELHYLKEVKYGSALKELLNDFGSVILCWVFIGVDIWSLSSYKSDDISYDISMGCLAIVCFVLSIYYLFLSVKKWLKS